ncbi:unnamed protein product [Sympodiomycopsis kandeliae]
MLLPSGGKQPRGDLRSTFLEDKQRPVYTSSEEGLHDHGASSSSKTKIKKKPKPSTNQALPPGEAVPLPSSPGLQAQGEAPAQAAVQAQADPVPGADQPITDANVVPDPEEQVVDGDADEDEGEDDGPEADDVEREGANEAANVGDQMPVGNVPAQEESVAEVVPEPVQGPVNQPADITTFLSSFAVQAIAAAVASGHSARDWLRDHLVDFKLPYNKPTLVTVPRHGHPYLALACMVRLKSFVTGDVAFYFDDKDAAEHACQILRQGCAQAPRSTTSTLRSTWLLDSHCNPLGSKFTCRGHPIYIILERRERCFLISIVFRCTRDRSCGGKQRVRARLGQIKCDGLQLTTHQSLLEGYTFAPASSFDQTLGGAYEDHQD